MKPNKAIAVISFGTTYSKGAESIVAVERTIKESFQDYRVVSAYTSNIVRNKLMESNIVIPSPSECLENLCKDGITEVIVLATHLLGGDEYSKVIDSVREYASKFNRIQICRPLIEPSDISKIVNIIISVFTVSDDDFLVFMGHGSNTQSNKVYRLINEELISRGIENIYIATVEATPQLEQAIDIVRPYNPNKVILTPLMLVSGDHANNDMAIEWKSAFEKFGYHVECILKGIGEYSEFRNVYIDRVKEVLC